MNQNEKDMLTTLYTQAVLHKINKDQRYSPDEVFLDCLNAVAYFSVEADYLEQHWRQFVDHYVELRTTVSLEEAFEQAEKNKKTTIKDYRL